MDSPTWWQWHVVKMFSISCWFVTFNTWKYGWNSRYFADDFFLEWKLWYVVSKFHLSLFPWSHKSALVQVVAWRRTGDKPVPQPMMTNSTDAYIGWVFAYKNHWKFGLIFLNQGGNLITTPNVVFVISFLVLYVLLAYIIVHLQKILLS